ncbi:hypothetical protein KDE13_09365 [Campylobacter sp. faydin G-140]|uniref:hypothetical protein n=1 Tax=Campylobacter anatolicus TaxID=2829105 RepID=UPI001B990C26|nr:hypothetical protein [Campylobacter anatolicus]MBR8466542.1 hypothetical protein [Campylobacter anatolicus]
MRNKETKTTLNDNNAFENKINEYGFNIIKENGNYDIEHNKDPNFFFTARNKDELIKNLSLYDEKLVLNTFISDCEDFKKRGKPNSQSFIDTRYEIYSSLYNLKKDLNIKTQSLYSKMGDEKYYGKELNQKLETILKKCSNFNQKNEAKEKDKDLYNTPLKRMILTKNTIDDINANEPLRESFDILKQTEINQKAIDELKSKIETSKEQNSDTKTKEQESVELSDKQRTYNKKENDLLKRHEKELEILEDKQNKLQTQFEKSIENLSNAKDVGGIIDFLKQIDNVIVLTLDHANATKEIHQKQLQEKMQLAFENPKMKEAVGELVKEIYNGKNELEKSYDEMKKMEKSYEELNKSIIKSGGKEMDKKELDNFEKQFENIKRVLPKFENTYPKTCKKANDIIKVGKEKIKNKSQETQRDMQYY